MRYTYQDWLSDNAKEKANKLAVEAAKETITSNAIDIAVQIEETAAKGAIKEMSEISEDMAEDTIAEETNIEESAYKDEILSPDITMIVP